MSPPVTRDLYTRRGRSSDLHGPALYSSSVSPAGNSVAITVSGTGPKSFDTPTFALSHPIIDRSKTHEAKRANSVPTMSQATPEHDTLLTCVDDRGDSSQQEQQYGRQQQGGRGGASRGRSGPHPAPCCMGGNTQTRLITNLGYMQPYCDADTSCHGRPSTLSLVGHLRSPQVISVVGAQASCHLQVDDDF